MIGVKMNMMMMIINMFVNGDLMSKVIMKSQIRKEGEEEEEVE
jgi:hypothetical protein